MNYVSAYQRGSGFLRFQFGIIKAGEQAKSQSAETKRGRGQHRKYLPYVFTEQGGAMLSTNKELAHKLAQLEHKTEKHGGEIKLIFDAIRQLMSPPETKRKKIGFKKRTRVAGS